MSVKRQSFYGNLLITLPYSLVVEFIAAALHVPYHLHYIHFINDSCHRRTAYI